MNFLLDFFKGLAIGIGAIAPGVSGGALAVIFGVYENLTYAIANIFNDFKRKALYLFPIGLGGIVGILVFSNIMEYLFKHYDIEVRYLFIGLMVGTFPSLLKIANKNGFKRKYGISFLIALLSTILLALLGNGNMNSSIGDHSGLFELIVYGVIIGFGSIVPGVSSSVILMYLGSYNVVLRAIASMNISLLMPMGIGFVLSFLLLAKIISLLFQYAYGYTYYAVLGFVIGSIIPIFPGAGLSLQYLISFGIMIIGFFVSFSLSKYEK